MHVHRCYSGSAYQLDAGREIWIDGIASYDSNLNCEKRGRACCRNLSHRYTSACSANIGKIALDLLGGTQPVPNQEGFVDQKTEIIGL